MGAKTALLKSYGKRTASRHASRLYNTHKKSIRRGVGRRVRRAVGSKHYKRMKQTYQTADVISKLATGKSLKGHAQSTKSYKQGARRYRVVKKNGQNRIDTEKTRQRTQHPFDATITSGKKRLVELKAETSMMGTREGSNGGHYAHRLDQALQQQDPEVSKLFYKSHAAGYMGSSAGDSGTNPFIGSA